MEEDIKYEEVQDALCVLLHCSLKDKEYETQKQQFDSVMNYIDRLQKENEELSRLNEKLEMEYNILLNAKVAIDIGSTESVGIEFLEEYIPKSVIQDKLNELKECDTSCLVEQIYNNGKKALCKELLNKGE